nr:hypothetical protein [Tanacetum cinerariifolium]
MYAQMRKFMQDMNVGLVRQAKKGLIIVGQHYGLNDFSGFQSMHGFPHAGPSSFPTQANSSFFKRPQATPSYGDNMATPKWQTPMPSYPGPSNCDKTKNKGKSANASPLNIENAFADDNVGEDDVMIMDERETGNYFVYENVDPIPHLCIAGSHSLERPNQEGWLSGDHMNAWIELLIREMPQNAWWIMSKLGKVCVYLETNRFIIPTDQHIIGTLDGSTRTYPTWNDVDWVYMPINVRGNHWVTGAVNLPNSIFYVFDSMHSEGT